MVVAAGVSDHDVALVFIDIAIIMVVARLMGALFRRFRQPAVVGEILAGILLGPTLLGAFPGQLPDKIFPPGEVRNYLGVIAQLGLIIFMFIVGLELDMKLVRGKERLAGVISLSSVALPFALGIGLAVVLHSNHDGLEGSADFWSFALFIGASMSVTAFPVLARILTERGMHRTPIGAIALACAAVDDILAWSLLAVVVAKVDSTGVWDLPRTLFLSVAFVALMFLVIKPQLEKVAARYRVVGRLTPAMLSVILVGVLVSSYTTEKIGIHQIFGAFLFGVIMPREESHELFREILERLEQVSVLVLLPVFFIATGLGVDVGGLSARNLVELALILVAACVGKFVGAAVGARAQGLPGRKAAAIGILMNTRGLTELVILNIGVSKGVLDQQLFTMLVVMAVFTTVITEPLLRVVYPDRILAHDIAEAERAALGVPDAYRVLVLSEGTAEDSRLLEVALDLVEVEEPAEVVLTSFRPFPKDEFELGAGVAEDLNEMTKSLGTLNDLAAAAERRGTHSVVLSQFSNDPARDLLSQASRVDADIILLERRVDDAGTKALATAVLEGAQCQVVVYEPTEMEEEAGEDSGLTAVVGDGSQGEAVLDVALRLASARSGVLRLAADPDSRRASRRLASLGGRFDRVGVTGTVVELADLSEGLVVGRLAARLPATNGPKMLVQPSEYRNPDELGNLVERLASKVSQGSEAGTTPTPTGGADPG